MDGSDSNLTSCLSELFLAIASVSLASKLSAAAVLSWL